MKTLAKSLVLATFLAMFVGVAPALAASPILSASYQGGSNLQLSISNANSYSPINLYTRQSSSLWTTVNNIGQTDGNGYFNQSISMPGDGSSNPLQLYVTVGGLQSSNISVYPNGGSNSNCTYYNNCSVGGLTLSQTSLSLNSGQTAYVTISSGVYNGYNNNFYISSNSNSSVASASISGSSVNIYGITSGSTSISICSNSGGSGCASVYVTVNGNSNNCTYYNNCNSGSLTLSQSSLILTQGQASNVTVSGSVYGGTPYISSNSNSSVASASVSGNVVYVNGISSGNTNISICQNGSSACATLYVTVSGSGCYNSYSNCGGSGSLSLSQTSLSLSAGQSSTITVYGNGSYYVSNNSNSAVASASVSGNTLYIGAIGNGSSTITICQSYNGSQCGTLYVTVTGNSGNTSVYFSPSSINIALAQSASVNIYSNINGSYYVSSNSNSGIVSASVSGNTLYLYGSQNGTASISVCQSGYSGCGTLYVTVGNGSSNCAYYSYSNCGNNSVLSLSQTSLNLAAGQSSTITVSGNGSYYVSSNSNPYAVSASISGNSLYVSAVNTGSSTISVCQNSYNTCATLYVTVSSNYAANVSLSQTSLSLSQGQTATVNIFGSSGYGYYVSSNSNPGVAVVSQSGSVLSVYGSQSGSSTIQVCQNSANACATLYVTVGGGTGTGCYSNCGGVTYPGGGVLGASTYQNGELINSNGTIYIVYRNEETGFASSRAFTGLGFSFSNVVNVGASGLPGSGYTVSTPYAQHPWGAWIKSGQTVYFVHQSGLIPVPNWSTFLNNGGQASWIVPANTYDFSLPIMAPMTNNDSRLQ